MSWAFLLAAALALPEMPAAYRVDATAANARAATATTLRYPDADTVVVANATHVTYSPDGTGVMWEETWTKALTEKGRKSLRTCTTYVSERYGKAEIQLVEIVGTNGVSRAVDIGATLRKATDNGSEGANIYDPLDKRITCAVPGMAVGETLRVITCDRIEKPRMRGAFATGSTFESMRPVLEDVFTVVAPRERPLRSVKLRNPVGKTVTRAPARTLADGATLHRWTARDVPQAFPEPSMPAFGSVAQKVLVSTLGDWREVSRWYWNLCAPHLAATNAAMVAKAAELARAPDPVRALFRFVSQEVRYMGLTLEDESPGYAPHDVCVTFDNRYGVCRDKAALLAAMLRLAGIEAYPVLIMVGPKIDADVPSPSFNHAIVGVRNRDGGYALMDPTAESTKDLFPAYLMNRSYLVAHPGGETLRVSPVTPAAENALTMTGAGTLDLAGNAVLTETFAFGGINDNAYRGAFLRKTPRERRDFFEALLRRVSPGAELLACEIAPADLRDTSVPLSAKITAKLPDLVLRGATRDELDVPFLGEGFGVANFLLDGETALEQRRYPLLLSTTAEVHETLTLRCDDAVGALRSVPDGYRERAGGYVTARAFGFTNGVLRAANRRTIGAVEYSPEEYRALRAARAAAEKRARERPVFAARETAAEADVRLVSSVTEVDIETPRRYTVTNTWEREVLTYAGKKNSAELKYAWNPACETFELAYAVVSNRDGRVLAAGAKERTELDANWAASAPRYPAGKRLVVNLPGVEIGSVIRVRTIRTVRDAAEDFSDFLLFDSADPIGVKSCRITSRVPFHLEGRAIAPCVTNAFCRAVTNPPAYRREPNQPAASQWRDWAVVSMADYGAFAAELDGALAAARAAGFEKARARAAELVADAATPEAAIKAVRDELFRSVRIAGPGVHALPFDRAFFPPDRALADGYASLPDWMNLYRTMLEEAGFDVTFVLPDNDAGALDAVRGLRRRVARPDCFGGPLLHVRAPRGCFAACLAPFGLADEPRAFLLQHENEYTPVGTTSHGGEEGLDLDAGEVVPLAEAAGELAPLTRSRTVIRIDAAGDARFETEQLEYGHDVGGLRRKYATMLPEMRWRHYQELLGDIAESASAMGELETDVESYPFRCAFRAYVPGFATVRDGAVSVDIGAFGSVRFGVGGPERHTPILLATAERVERVREVVFPPGYTEVEHLPADYVLPEGGSCRVTHALRDGCLVVTLRYTFGRPRDLLFGPEMFHYFRARNRETESAPARTLVIRRATP